MLQSMDGSTSGYERCLKRNCALSPLQFASACLGLNSILLIIGVFFWIHGASYVLLFSLMEVTAMGIAFIAYARHATDHERIALIEGMLLVEQLEAGNLTRTWLVPAWTRVIVPTHQRGLIKLEYGRMQLHIGRHLVPETRQQFARELVREMLNYEREGVQKAGGGATLHEGTIAIGSSLGT